MNYRISEKKRSGKINATILIFSLIYTILVGSDQTVSAQKSFETPGESLATRSVATYSALPVEVPDNDPNGTDLYFNISGVTGFVNRVEISFGFNPAHTWAGDVKAVLYAPNNASHTLVDRVGETITGGAGDSSDLSGPYTFTDQGGDFWTAASAANSSSEIAAGFYRTTSNGSGSFTNMDPVFAGPGYIHANGIWRLNVSDNGEGDTGSLSSATLTIYYSIATAANISIGGRVSHAHSGIRNATLMLVGGNLTEPVYVKTNDFGEYKFTELLPGQIYVVTVLSKKFRFSQPSIVLTPQSDVSDADFLAEE